MVGVSVRLVMLRSENARSENACGASEKMKCEVILQWNEMKGEITEDGFTKLSKYAVVKCLWNTDNPFTKLMKIMKANACKWSETIWRKI